MRRPPAPASRSRSGGGGSWTSLRLASTDDTRIHTMPKQFQPVVSLGDQAALAAEGRLLEVAQKFDEKLRERVTRLLLASAEAIIKLADLDLVRHEADEERGGHTLAPRGERAPGMGETVPPGNDLVGHARAQVLPPPPRAHLDPL